jgi:hypothetical protein
MAPNLAIYSKNSHVLSFPLPQEFRKLDAPGLCSLLYRMRPILGAKIDALITRLLIGVVAITKRESRIIMYGTEPSLPAISWASVLDWDSVTEVQVSLHESCSCMNLSLY